VNQVKCRRSVYVPPLRPAASQVHITVPFARASAAAGPPAPSASFSANFLGYCSLSRRHRSCARLYRSNDLMTSCSLYSVSSTYLCVPQDA
jgi:hypothetical protein